MDVCARTVDRLLRSRCIRHKIPINSPSVARINGPPNTKSRTFSFKSLKFSNSLNLTQTYLNHHEMVFHVILLALYRLSSCYQLYIRADNYLMKLLSLPFHVKCHCYNFVRCLLCPQPLQSNNWKCLRRSRLVVGLNVFVD